MRAAATAIERLADALYPEDPAQARIDLLEIAGLAVLRNQLPGGALERLARRLLPAERVTGVTARVLLAQQQAAPALWHTVPAVALVDALPAEFPRVQDRTLARACVLEALARTGRAAVDPELLPPGMAVDLSTLLGRPVDDPGLVFAELMFASLEADPDNRDGYLFLLDLLRGRTGVKPRLQRVLQEMAARFPDDSTPWLELATLHYSKNAYRQAEHALEEARRRANARRPAPGSAGRRFPQVRRSHRRPTITDPRGSVIVQSAGNVRSTNAPAGRNGASSGDRRRRRGLRRVTAAAWPSQSRCRQGSSASRRGNDHSRKPYALAAARGMVIDDDLVNAPRAHACPYRR